MTISDAKENLPTEQSPPGEETRLSRTDGDEKRTCGVGASSSERTQTLDSASLLNQNETIAEADLEQSESFDFTLPKHLRLRKPAEFQTVYKNGKRFDGRFASAFVLPNNLPNHRLGITASRKAVGKAVGRNRAKRLLREAFRLSKIELNQLAAKYDFVLNARRNLLGVKMQDSLADFHKLISQIKKHESAVQTSANNYETPNVNLTAE